MNWLTTGTVTKVQGKRRSTTQTQARQSDPENEYIFVRNALGVVELLPIRIRNKDAVYQDHNHADVGTDRRDYDGGTSEEVRALVLVTAVRVVVIATVGLPCMIDQLYGGRSNKGYSCELIRR